MASAPVDTALAQEPAAVRRLRLGAVWASFGAAFVHTVVSGGHAQEWWGYGAFFVTAAGAQAVFAILLLGQPWRHDEAGRYDPARGADVARVVYGIGIAVNLAMVALYALTRTVGIPVFGPEAGQREALDPAGVICVALELALCACLAALLAGEPAGPHATRSAGDGGRA